MNKCYECSKPLPNKASYDTYQCDDYYFCGRECMTKYKRKRDARKHNRIDGAN